MILILEHFCGGWPSQPGKWCEAPPAPEFCFELLIPGRRGRCHLTTTDNQKPTGGWRLGANLLMGSVN